MGGCTQRSARGARVRIARCGRPAEGRCPECGAAVGASVRGDFLCYADPAWVEGLAGGTTWILVSIGLSIVFTVIGEGIAEVTGNTGASWALDTVGSIVFTIGVWRITVPDPGRLGAEPPVNIRSVYP